MVNIAEQIVRLLEEILHTTTWSIVSGRGLAAFSVLVPLTLVMAIPRSRHFVGRLSGIFAIRRTESAQTLLPTTTAPSGNTRPTLVTKPQQRGGEKFVTGGGCDYV